MADEQVHPELLVPHAIVQSNHGLRMFGCKLGVYCLQQCSIALEDEGLIITQDPSPKSYGGDSQSGCNEEQMLRGG